jgi:general secretion pathway protein A
VVLVVDEAQNLSPEVLEQVRLLTNLETNTQKLLQIILIGQPELRELLSRNELRQLAQRVTGRYHLSPLSRAETSAYVLHRLRVAGSTSDIFSQHALNEVYRLSQGVPRVINVISDRSLLGAYSLDRHRVTGNLVRHAAREVFGQRPTPRWLPWAATAGAVALVILAAALLFNLRPAGLRSAAAAPPPDAASTAASTAAPSKGALADAPAAGLSTLLTRHAADTNTDSAFGKLFTLWGAKYTPGGDPCAQAARQGLECLSERGSFGQLRLYNHPAILLLSDAAGGTHQLVLTGLDDEHARLELGAVSEQVAIAELARYWMGDFVMLWRPANSPVKALSAGMRGADVRWLRKALLQLRGQHSDGVVSDVFDDELTGEVREFQRAHQLTVDGIAGLQTQIALAGAVAAPSGPLLFTANTHGG